MKRAAATLALAAVAVSGIGMSGASFTSESSNVQTVSAVPDFVAPTIDRSIVERTAGGGSGYVKQGQQYFVYANVTDTGNPASGISSVTADVSSVTSGQTAASLSSGGGPYTVGGQSYNYRSAALTAGNPLSEGSKPYTVSSTDAASNSGTTSGLAVLVDNSAPTVDAAVLAATSGGNPVGGAGFIRQGGTYKVYANSSDVPSGANGSGVASATANVNNLTTGQTAVALTFDATGVTIGGTTYHWISAQLTANPSGLSNGAKTFTALATDNLGTAGTAQSFSVTVDTTIPTATMTDPGTGPFSGTITLGATATDASAGVASVTIQRSPNGAGTWTDVCTDATSPYSCSFDTTQVADGKYDFRAVATDNAGNAATSASRNGKQVDNVGPTVSLVDPGAGPFTGNVALTASAADVNGSGVSQVGFQWSPAGTGSWSDITLPAACADTTSPYQCTFDTHVVTDNTSFDLRAVATDDAGHSTTSATVTRSVGDNSPIGLDVQTFNNGILGKPELGDAFTLSYSETMAAGTILSGWNGSSTNVVVRITDAGGSDVITVFNSTNTTQVNVGSVTKFDGVSGSITFGLTGTPSTMVRSGRDVTITLGTVSDDTKAKTTTATKTIEWTPSASAQDLTGHACGTAIAVESGAADAEF